MLWLSGLMVLCVGFLHPRQRLRHRNLQPYLGRSEAVANKAQEVVHLTSCDMLALVDERVVRGEYQNLQQRLPINRNQRCTFEMAEIPKVLPHPHPTRSIVLLDFKVAAGD